jgi:NADH-quinone oxidoreductase subunit J
MITVSCLATLLFFGGWHSPFPPNAVTMYLPAIVLLACGALLIWDGVKYPTKLGKLILPVLGVAVIGLGALSAHPAVIRFVQGPFWFLSKVAFFLFFYVWLRAALPLRPVDGLRVEAAAAAVAGQRGADEPDGAGGAQMSGELVLFSLAAAVAVLGAVSLILQRHPIHSALSLIVVMVALAALYLLQGAEFMAAVQIIVYAGAIMVLFVFVIMLLNAGEEERTNRSRLARYVGIPLGILLTLQLAYAIARGASPESARPMWGAEVTRNLARLLFRDFVLPFELTSVLILVAILGAVVLAKREV